MINMINDEHYLKINYGNKTLIMCTDRILFFNTSKIYHSDNYVTFHCKTCHGKKRYR